MMDRNLRRKRCRGNLKPAPFFLSPQVIAQVVALSARERVRAVAVPVLPITLTDRPRRSEDPRLAKANDNSHDSEINSALSTSTGTAPRSEEALPGVRESQMERIQVTAHRGQFPRIEIIRAAAEKLRQQQLQSQTPARVLPGRKTSVAAAIPPLPCHARAQALGGAIAWLKSLGIIVQVHDRSALVRRYLVSGRSGTKMAEEVIALAQAKGMKGLSGAHHG